MLQRLLGLDFPPDSSLTSVALSLRGGIPGWLLVVLLIAVVVLTAGLYRTETSEAPPRRRWILAACRGGALSLALLLIAKPTLVAEATGQRPRCVALMIDNSTSMRQTDRRVANLDLLRVAIAKGQASADTSPDLPEWQSAAKEELATLSRADIVRAGLNNPRLNLVGQLMERGQLKPYLFGSKPQQVGAAGLAKSISADADRSAVWDAIMEVATAPDADPPAAIVLITDGLDNASKTNVEEVAAECARAGISIHIWGVGSADSGTVRIIDAAIPETIFVDDVVSLPVRWRYRGSGKAAANITVLLGGKEIARQDVTLSPGDGKDAISFPTPKSAADVTNPELAVTIRLKDDPLPADELRKPVVLSERRVRVLVIDDSPRWEFKFLQPALSRDRRVEANYLVAQGDPRAMKGAPFLPAFPSRDQLFKYDLVVLGDVAPTFLGADNMTTLADYVREGGGLAVVAGRKHMPAEYVDTPLAEVFPVEFVPARFPPDPEVRTSAFEPELTPAGRQSTLMSLAETGDENDRAWKELPGLYWHYPVNKLRPGASSLLAHPKRLADGLPMPLIATHYYGKGPVAFMAIDETWRWRYNSEDRVYARFWGQVVYQLGLPHLIGHGSRVQLMLDRSDAVVGRPGYVYARLYDPDFRPYVSDKVPAVLESIDPHAPPRAVTFDPVPGRPGEFRVMLPHDAPGRFELKLTQPDAGSLPFRVILPPGHELEPAGLNDVPLRQLADATKGGLYREEELHRLPRMVTPRTAPFTARQEVVLWGPLALILFVGLVTAEWIGRKLADMS